MPFRNTQCADYNQCTSETVKISQKCKRTPEKCVRAEIRVSPHKGGLESLEFGGL